MFDMFVTELKVYYADAGCLTSHIDFYFSVENSRLSVI